jgi:hypothetical protein
MAFSTKAAEDTAKALPDKFSIYSRRPDHDNAQSSMSDGELAVRLARTITELRHRPDVREECCGEQMLRHVRNLELMAYFMERAESSAPRTAAR